MASTSTDAPGPYKSAGSSCRSSLVVTSDNDHLIPAELSELIAAKVPGAKLQVVRGGGHIPFMEQPETVVPMVVDFLTSLKPSTQTHSDECPAIS